MGLLQSEHCRIQDQGCSYGGRRCPLMISARQKIAQYTYLILKMTLSGSETPPGALPLDPRSLALRFVCFTNSACHYYSPLRLGWLQPCSRLLALAGISRKADIFSLSMLIPFIDCKIHKRCPRLRMYVYRLSANPLTSL